jgi:hypothetical protein
LKLDESQRKRLESLFNTAYGVVKAGKSFSDYELICEIQVKNGLDLGENYRNINGCTFAASIAQTLGDKQVKFQILSYKLGLGKSLTGLGLEKFKKPWLGPAKTNFQPLALYAFSFVDSFLIFKFLLKNPSNLFALLVMFPIWVFQVRLLDTVNPRYLASLTSSNICPLRV